MENHDHIHEETKEDIKYHPFERQPQHPMGVGYLAKHVGQTDNVGFFAFLRALYDRRFYEEDWPHGKQNGIKSRCDGAAPPGMPMPAAWHDWDYKNNKCLTCESETAPYGTTDSHMASLNNMKILRMPIQSQYGFITYIEMEDPEEELEAFRGPQVSARTLQEMFRLLIEWEWAYNELNNREEYAIVAKNMIEDLGMSDSIKEWLWNELPPMRVVKYVSGDTNAWERADSSLIPEMTEEFKEWCLHLILGRAKLWTYGPG
jgi:hypothetical protein